MSSSWNFPSWAKPSWKVPEPSRAKLGTSHSCIFFWYIIFLPPFFIIVVANFSTQNNSFSNKKKYYSPQRTQKKEWKCWGNKGKHWIGKKAYLLRHKMTNTGEKPYDFRYCDLRFSQTLCAKIQERTHTWEKPYDWINMLHQFLKRNFNKLEDLVRNSILVKKCTLYIVF